jgi:hypothetical protein
MNRTCHLCTHAISPCIQHSNLTESHQEALRAAAQVDHSAVEAATKSRASQTGHSSSIMQQAPGKKLC